MLRKYSYFEKDLVHGTGFGKTRQDTREAQMKTQSPNTAHTRLRCVPEYLRSRSLRDFS